MSAPAEVERASERDTPDVWATLLAVQSELSTLPKDKVNPHFGSRFTGLDTLVEITRPVFQRYGLVWSTAPTIADGQPALTYKLCHIASDTAITDTMPLVLVKQDSQALGSAITYARRYALQAILDVVGDEDDDAEAASDRTRPETQQAGGPTVNMQQQAKGLRDEAINAALSRAGLTPQERPWGLLGRIPEDRAEALGEALRLQRQMA